MANKADIQKGAIDAAIVIAGAALLDQFVVSKVTFIADLMVKLPADIMGISIKAFVLGATSLILFRMYAR